LRVTELQVKTKAGLALIALGVSILGTWHWWSGTRNLGPVNVPVPSDAGQSVTSEFKLNFDGLYLIEIEAEQTIPLDVLHCLMGVEADPVQCKSTLSVINATWVLSSQGREIGQGSSRERHSAPVLADGVARVIGEFQGKAGTSYKLQTTFATGVGDLRAAHPRLRVKVADIAHVDLQTSQALVYATAMMCGLFGLILLGVAYFLRR
jgi:hypothetical protein